MTDLQRVSLDISILSVYTLCKELYALMFEMIKKTSKTQRQVNQIQVKSQLLHWFYMTKIIFDLKSVSEAWLTKNGSHLSVLKVDLPCIFGEFCDFHLKS